MRIATGDITGVILCGGNARRMGGVEKPLQPLHGRPLVAHVCDRLVPQVGHVIISANREVDRYAQLGHDVVRDAEAGLGPLEGVRRAAMRARTRWLFCCPGDAPLLDKALASRLAAAMMPEDDGACPHDGERRQHLFLLVRTSVCHTLPAYLSAGERSVQGWLATRRVPYVPVPDLAGSFVNVNTPAELVRLQRGAGHQPPTD